MAGLARDILGHQTLQGASKMPQNKHSVPAPSWGLSSGPRRVASKRHTESALFPVLGFRTPELGMQAGGRRPSQAPAPWAAGGSAAPMTAASWSAAGRFPQAAFLAPGWVWAAADRHPVRLGSPREGLRPGPWVGPFPS